MISNRLFRCYLISKRELCDSFSQLVRASVSFILTTLLSLLTESTMIY